MKRYRLIFTVSILALIASGTTIAGQIYKWTDEDGTVHYVDRPTGHADESRLDIVSARTDDAAVMARVQTRREARAVAEQVAAEAPPELTRDEIRAEQQERQEKCQTYRDRLEHFLRSQRLYKEDEAGERQYLDEKEILAARERVQKQIVEYCGQ